ncbi:hypothetical protein WBO87_18185, partial [Nocardioides sp. CCNWLW212]
MRPFIPPRLARPTVLALVVALSLTACGGNDSSSSSPSGDSDAASVTFIPKNLGNAYFDTSNAGGKKAVE